MATTDWDIVLDNFNLNERLVPQDSQFLVKLEHMPESDYKTLEVLSGSILVPTQLVFHAADHIKQTRVVIKYSDEG